MTIIDDKENYLRTNETFQKMLGYSAQELSSRNIFDLTHPEDAEESREIVRNLKSGAVPRNPLEKRLYRKDGKLIWVRITPRHSRDPPPASRSACRSSRTSPSARWPRRRWPSTGPSSSPPPR